MPDKITSLKQKVQAITDFPRKIYDKVFAMSSDEVKKRLKKIKASELEIRKIQHEFGWSMLTRRRRILADEIIKARRTETAAGVFRERFSQKGSKAGKGRGKKGAGSSPITSLGSAPEDGG